MVATLACGGSTVEQQRCDPAAYRGKALCDNQLT